MLGSFDKLKIYGACSFLTIAFLIFFSFFQFKIDRQQKDINQLESLCGYLEKKLFLDEELDNIVS